MKQWRWLVYALIMAAMGLGTVGVHSAPVARAQGRAPWLEVWYFPADDLGPALVEYRDAAGTVLASYALASNNIVEFAQGGGYLVTDDNLNTIGVFDPRMGLLRYYQVVDKPEDTDAEFYVLSHPAPAPNGDLAYAISRVSSQFDVPSYNSIYYADPAYQQVRTIYELESAEPWYTVTPFAWSGDGSTLLLHNQPQGIGGYILFWTYQGVQARPLANMEQVTWLGDLDGFADDLSRTALVAYDDQYVVQGINVIDVASGAQTFYPLPALGETAYTGGNAHFSPSGTRLAYQVARENAENEKFWTIGVDLTNGQSQVVFAQEFTEDDWDYAYVAGWLDDATLVIGGPWAGPSRLVNVETGAVTEVPGVFLGYAQGVSDVSDFAPPGMVPVQCDTSPVSGLAPQVRGRVMDQAGMVNVYSWASYDSEVVAQAQSGAVFTVLDGPQCIDSTLWWSVRFDNGVEGYVIEGNYQGRYLEPLQ